MTLNDQDPHHVFLFTRRVPDKTNICEGLDFDTWVRKPQLKIMS